MTAENRAEIAFLRSGRPEPARKWYQTGRGRAFAGLAVVLVVALGGYALYQRFAQPPATASAAPPPPAVTVSAPLVEQVAGQATFLGQFSAVDRVEIRAQVGGTLSEILFTDGQIVHKGDPLFVIDTRPYEIRLRQAQSTLKTAQSQLALSKIQLWRAQQLRTNNFGSVEMVDQRQSETDAGEAAVESGQQAVSNAQLDLDYCHVAAPFTGRVSRHLVSVGNLVAGSRAATSPTTLLTTVVSLDPIYLDFDMSETDFINYQRSQKGNKPDGEVSLNLSGDKKIHKGKLTFIDNEINRASGTIHARATVDNPDLSLVPGEFAELTLTLGAPAPALLVPDAAVSVDQSNHVVMTVADDGTVVPKQVVLGGMYQGLRVVRDGLAPTDRLIIDGQVRARPGAKVVAEAGSLSLKPTSTD